MIDLICVARLMTLLCRSTAKRQVVLSIFTPWQFSTRLYGVTSQQTQIFTIITVKTSNLTQLNSTVRSLHRFKIIQTKRPKQYSTMKKETAGSSKTFLPFYQTVNSTNHIDVFWDMTWFSLVGVNKILEQAFLWNNCSILP